MPNGEGIADTEAAEPLEIPIPGPAGQNPGDWKLIAHNRKVLEGWRLLCRQILENAIRCHRWLREHPAKPIPGCCYGLKHKRYSGVWCYEIGSGQRVYYILRQSSLDVLIYYAGPHPKAAPYPPAE